MTKAALGLSLLAISLGTAWAQRTTANLYGIVEDSSGAVVPAASVRVTSDATAAQYETKSNERGEFTLSFLPPGV
jgi:hypothetical protein